MEKYVKTFKGAKPAPSSDDVEWCSSFLTFPMNVMRDVVVSERLDVTTECSGSTGVINRLPHVSLVSLLESNCATSVGLSGVCV